MTVITPASALRLNEPSKRALMVHGSCYLAPYIFGSCRGRGNDSPIGIVRIHQNNYATYDTAEIHHPDYGLTAIQGLDAICAARGKIWLTIQTGSGIAIISVDATTLAVTIEFETNLTGDSAQWILVDGNTLLFDSNVRICSFDMDTHAFAMGNMATHVESPTTFHSGIFDGTHIFAISSTNGDGHAVYCVKILRSTLTFVDRVQVPKCTDDMSMDSTYVYGGVEILPGSSSAFGYGSGAVAIRKSDLATFYLPPLAASDNADVPSYCAAVIGAALFNLKTNAHTYMTDITDPSTWTLATLPSSVELFDLTFTMPPELGNASSFTAPNFPNELLLDENGNFHAFCWPTANPFGFDNSVTNDLSSGLIKFTVPGFSPLPPPVIVEQDGSAILSAISSLSGAGTLESTVLQPLYPVLNHPLLSQIYLKLKTPDEQVAYNVLAELVLNLRAPVYTGTDGLELTYAVVAQINFQLEHGLTPEVVKSVSQASHSGNTTLYRDRYVSPIAWHIVQRVTKIQNVAYKPPGIGV